MKYSSENIADNLIYWIGERKTTGKSVAEAAGITPMTLTNYKAGRRMANSYTLCKLADVLGVTPNDLLTKR